MIRRCFLLVMIALLCCNGVLAREKEQVTNLFEGDSLAMLNEDQIKILDYAVKLICENDTVVVLPQEINTLMGDTASICYLGSPNWNLAYFICKEKRISLRIPIYTETPLGIVKSFLYVSQDENNNIDSYVCTYMSDNSLYKGTTMFSSIQGEFMYGKLYKDNKFICRIEGEKLVEERIKGPKPRYNSDFKKLKYNNDPYINTIYEIKRNRNKLDWIQNDVLIRNRKRGN